MSEITTPIQPSIETSPAFLPPGVADRRRPGRPKTVSPHLIPIMRDPSGRNDAPSPQVQPGHDLVPVLGILTGLVLSVPVWAVIAGITWAIERWV